MALPMSHLYWLNQAQIDRIKHCFPKERGLRRGDGRRVLSGIVHAIKNGLRWCDAPSDYGPHKTLYNREHVFQAEGLAPHRHALATVAPTPSSPPSAWPPPSSGGCNES